MDVLLNSVLTLDVQVLPVVRSVFTELKLVHPWYPFMETSALAIVMHCLVTLHLALPLSGSPLEEAGLASTKLAVCAHLYSRDFRRKDRSKREGNDVKEEKGEKERSGEKNGTEEAGKKMQKMVISRKEWDGSEKEEEA